MEHLLYEDFSDTKQFMNVACQPVRLTSIKTAEGAYIPEYKAVYNSIQERAVSVVSDKYKLLPNKTILEPILEYLENSDKKFTIGDMSYVNSSRCRLHLNFPEHTIDDDSTDGIISSLFFHNSYNMKESARLIAGAMRMVCSNGMVVGTIVKEIHLKHSNNNIADKMIANLEVMLGGLENSTKAIEKRLAEMIEQTAVAEDLITLYNTFGETVFRSVLLQMSQSAQSGYNMSLTQLATIKNEDYKSFLAEDVNDFNFDCFNQYDMYNFLTWYVAHVAQTRYRVDLLNKASKLYKI